MLKKNIAWIAAAIFAAGILYAILTPAVVNKDIGNDELTSLAGKGALVVDVRTPSEFSAAHIPGAVNVPIDQLPQVITTWDKKAPVVVYCATGARSANAAALLKAQGFTKVYNLAKGIVAWTGATETGGGSASATLPSQVATNGKPLFIDFASST